MHRDHLHHQADDGKMYVCHIVPDVFRPGAAHIPALGKALGGLAGGLQHLLPQRYIVMQPIVKRVQRVKFHLISHLPRSSRQ